MSDGQWFQFGDAHFLIEPLDPKTFLLLNEKLEAGETGYKEATETLAKAVLADFKGMEDPMNDIGACLFIMEKSRELLDLKTERLLRFQAQLERALLVLGKLKS